MTPAMALAAIVHLDPQTQRGVVVEAAVVVEEAVAEEEGGVADAEDDWSRISAPLGRVD